MEDKIPGEAIVAAIRSLRTPAPQLRPGTKTGVQLSKVWSVCSATHNEAKFKLELNLLLQSGKLVGTWLILEGVTKDSRHTDFSPRLFLAVPDGMILNQIHQSRDRSGRYFVDPKGEYRDIHDQISEPKLYVVGDGLPGCVQKIMKKVPTRPAKKSAAA